mmetsp:Transcript_16544/g.31449  ORF Transcript_16544/g.31449 Transcript_16544/m.31449 type:complete len:333 (-) Transcript_16544:74-1072(-)
MEATPEQAAEGLAIVQVLATVLDRLVTANTPLARTDPGQVTKFHAMKAPGIGILQYLERILKYASCSNECFIMALIYIDRLIQSNNFLLTELNVHRVVITAVLLAAKFFDDAYYNNAYYAKVGGVLVSEMNGLEVDFLFRINFTLHVTPEVFAKYRGELLAQSQALSPPPPTTITAYTQTSYVSCVNPQQPPNGDAMPPQTTYSSVDPFGAPQHITPSPPADAAKMAQDEMIGMQYADAQLLHYRSNSMPEPTDTGMSWVPQRCAQSSYSAPVSAPAPYSSAPYNPNHLIKDHDRLVAAAMANQILPLQNGLSHHHHGMYVQQKADPRLQPC